MRGLVINAGGQALVIIAVKMVGDAGVGIPAIFTCDSTQLSLGLYTCG
jgi:hypothetical protein